MERTFAMLKPDVLKKNLVGKVLAMAEEHGYRLAAMRLMTLKESEVDALYAEHVGRDFYPGLRAFMLSGPVVALLLEREDAVTKWRALMGSTDSTKAAQGTVRFLFGGSPVYVNAVHGSDGPDAAAREIGMFFPDAPA